MTVWSFRSVVERERGEGAAPQQQETLAKSAQNLLVHIPGEASGLYLMAVDAIAQPTVGALIFVFVLSLILLILVRWLARASLSVVGASLFAFLLWMLILEKGLIHFVFPNLLPVPLGLILAVFYSTAVTLLANAGKIK